jgi:hypothetical protein
MGASRPTNVIAAQPRARRLVEIVRFNAQDAREFSDPLVRDAIASVFIAADLPRRHVGGVGKLAHCHPAMLTVFLQALSDVCIDGALAIPKDHSPNAKNGRRYFSVSIRLSTAVTTCSTFGPRLSQWAQTR